MLIPSASITQNRMLYAVLRIVELCNNVSKVVNCVLSNDNQSKQPMSRSDEACAEFEKKWQEAIKAKKDYLSFERNKKYSSYLTNFAIGISALAIILSLIKLLLL